jgi:RNA polymerase sigma factor (sigma-70 family)
MTSHALAPRTGPLAPCPLSRPGRGRAVATIRASLGGRSARPGPREGSPIRAAALAATEAPLQAEARPASAAAALDPSLAARQSLLDAAYAAPAAPPGPAGRAASSRGASTSAPAAEFVASTRGHARRRAPPSKAAPAPSAVVAAAPRPATISVMGHDLELEADDAAEAAFMARLRARLAGPPHRGGAPGAAAAGGGAGVAGLLRGHGAGAGVLTGPEERRLARLIAGAAPLRAAAAALAPRLGRRPTLAEAGAAAGLAGPGAAAAAALARDATELLVQYNLRLVASIARRYRNQGLPLDDLLAEGAAGLRRAVGGFDPARGFRFSTYATWWVRQAMSRALSSQSRDVRLPAHVVERLGRLQRAAAALRAAGGGGGGGGAGGGAGADGEPALEELAAAAGVPLEKLVALMRAARTPRAMEEAAAMALGGGFLEPPRADDVADEDADDGRPGAGGAVAAAEREEYLRAGVGLALATLPKRERNVLRLRFALAADGAGGAPPAEAPQFAPGAAGVVGLREVADCYGLSPERVRQIEGEALRRLRAPWRRAVLRGGSLEAALEGAAAEEAAGGGGGPPPRARGRPLLPAPGGAL